MLRALLIGLAAGQRGITPLAVVATVARCGDLGSDMPGATSLGHPAVAAGAAVLAAAEMAGDKMKTAPDRTVAIGLAVRGITAAYAGAALTPRRRLAGAAAAAAAALASAPLGLALRRRAMARFGQTATGFVEDALVTAIGQYAGRRG